MRFLSLRWKSMLLYSSLLLILLGCLTALTLYWFETYQQQLQEQRIVEERTNIERVLQLNSQLTIRSLESFIDNSRNQASIRPDFIMQNAFTAFWENNALRHDYVHAWLFDPRGSIVISWGTPPLFNWQSGLSDVLRNQTPQHEIICAEQCLQFVAIPVLWDHGQERVLIIASSLIQPVISLREIHHVDIALMIADNNAQYGSWPVRIQSLSNRQTLEPVISQISAQLSLKSLNQDSQTLTIDSNNFMLWIQQLGKENHTGYLLFIDNVTAQQQAINRYLWQVALLAALILCTGLSIAYLAYSSPIRRLRLQAKALPILAEQRFDEARQMLQGSPGLLLDELDQVEEAGIQLADKLEALTLEVQHRTTQLENMAMYDALTGLPNRRMLLQFLNQSLSELKNKHHLLAVILLDLDNFKLINDSLGHEIGDNLLVSLSQRLSNTLHSNDMVGRFGGDIFVVILPRANSRERVISIINALLEEIRQPLQLVNESFVMAASVGVTFANRSAPHSAEELIKQADTAVHEAKARGKNTFCIFEQQMTRTVEAQVVQKRELRLAVEQQQFCLHLQPQISLATNHLTGFEALIRWQHPERDLLSPIDFIYDLERSEHNIPVGFWVIEHGLTLLANACRHTRQNLKLAVNMNPELFLHDQLVNVIKQLLDKLQLSAEQLELELTESVLISDMAAVAHQMLQLSNLGVTIAIDDFGTGYSSLAYLRQLPVDVLKIDRAFVTNLPDNEKDGMLVCSILSMAEQLGMNVVAEGIERQEQARFLRDQGCPFGQGFGISRPIDEHDLLQVLDQRLENGLWLIQ